MPGGTKLKVCCHYVLKKTRNLLSKCICILFVIILVPNAFGQTANVPASLRLENNPYWLRTFVDDSGRHIDEIIVPGKPPAKKVPSIILPRRQILANGTLTVNVINSVPAFTWCYGCSATSAAMLMGYYDNAGYTNMYTGPANAGVCPMNNAVWGSTHYPSIVCGECPISASHQGIDGRLGKGHVDDYWIDYLNAGPDPYVVGEWTEHSPQDSTADFMGTSKAALANKDGSTTFYNYTDGSPLYDYTDCEPDARDGCHGMRLFVESCGYVVTANFSQYIKGYNGNIMGFTFDDFKAEIDAGRPVLIQVVGHSMVGYGYNDTGETIFIHNTWDWNDHQMTWGGVYEGMQHYGVTVLRMAKMPVAITGNPQSLTNNPGTVASFTVTASGTAPLFYQWQKNAVDIGVATNATYTIASVVAGNAGNYRCLVSNTVNVVTSAVASLAVNTPSGELPAPADVAASDGTYTDKVALTWSASSGALSYIVYRGHVSNSNLASEIANPSSTSYDDTSASPGSLCYYWVKALSSAATSSFSSVASGYRGLSEPTGVSASGGAYCSGVLVSWNGVNGAVSYRIWRSPTSDSLSAVNIGEAAATSYLDVSATPGKTYYYWVQSKKWSVTGSLSAAYASGWRRSMAAGNNARGDIDGDGIMDFAVYMEATGMWYVRLSGSAYATVSYQLGCPGFVPVSCDYDGDGHTDPTVYREPDGLWIALLSANGNTPAYAVLGGNGFKPVAGDFDGDGRADVVVYQESTGKWKALFSSRNYNLITTVYGGPGCKPVAADYDGDGKVDPAYYYEMPGSNLGENLGFWYMALSGSGYISYLKTTTGAGLVPVPADYDGDGQADVATYDAKSGTWHYWSSLLNYSLPISFTLGGAGYTAVPADYDGDGKADIAVYHEATGLWCFLLSSKNYASAYGELGGAGYDPVGARR